MLRPPGYTDPHPERRKRCCNRLEGLNLAGIGLHARPYLWSDQAPHGFAMTSGRRPDRLRVDSEDDFWNSGCRDLPTNRRSTGWRTVQWAILDGRADAAHRENPGSAPRQGYCAWPEDNYRYGTVDFMMMPNRTAAEQRTCVLTC